MVALRFADQVDAEGNRYFRLPNDDGPAIVFWGRLIAAVNDAERCGNDGYCQQLRLYRTRGGRWVVQKIKSSGYRLPDDSFVAAETASLDEAFAVLGSGRMVSELYALARNQR